MSDERLFRVMVALGAIGWYEVPATSRRAAERKTNEALTMSRNPWAHLDIVQGPYVEVQGTTEMADATQPED